MRRSWFFLFLFLPILVNAEAFIQGKDYEVFPQESLNKGALVEFFSYACPWCYRLEADVEHFVAAKKNTQFRRVPVIFHQDWLYYAKAYYLATLLQMNTKVDTFLFTEAQKNNLASDKAMVDFFIKQGVDKQTAESAFLHSTTMDVKVQAGQAWMQRFHVTAVPAFVVANRYKTDLQMAKNPQRLFAIISYLQSL